ncbi:ComEC/Rec2 family competence protein [Pedobacter sp. Leaf170]|uniref:ComEC/Rec2 family competence protein n=1 Tax=Pedobacter sp. Leaf170 TaxID=2876558 RepID=UPI001E2DA84D|nr:hypothetical protein [Pedobacter sp. Leaf170]
MSVYKIVTSLTANTYKTVPTASKKGGNNTLLMGSYVKLLGQSQNNFSLVSAFGIDGWIDNADIGDEPGLKIFFVDVGQGDGALIEVGNNFKMLIDGGPGNNMAAYLNKWQYTYYHNLNQKVHINYIIVSHFDKDHYECLIDIINDVRYTFGTILHNGIAKFNEDNENFATLFNCGLGKKEKIEGKSFLTTTFDSIEDLNKLKDTGMMQRLHEKFCFAVSNAKKEGRLKSFKRVDHKTRTINLNEFTNVDFKLDILGPVTAKVNDKTAFDYFKDDAHTVNGHSVVVKLIYGKRSFLFGGDLNIPSEEHLLKHYKTDNPFRVDVAKSCHHGASEFTVDFMKQVSPIATVISSGDNESYAHPRADAIGCAGKYSASDRPLVFSTELARSIKSANEIKFGMINLRCNGTDFIMAQMKEVARQGSVWDLYNPK